MDMARNEVRKLAADDYTTTQHLEHASQQARERNYQDFLIVDVDSHHYESESYKEVFQYIESPVIRRAGARILQARPARLDARRHRSATRTFRGRITRHDARTTTSAATTSPAASIATSP